ncbi:helix-turn-helix domain-containing protein [Defluviimonas sp. WL0002]|uniref:Helix-turn-helix domain-containing protein n=1 Tax=Albidovulum marisflavi TaxID=2984159 RepID=A0ABT2ZB94_9RHOB|nr:helix-turn-helix domain-containing protein [Defluviimonas sp. WL0002]MCV2868403.1 helix-turn-helix domain-containing protein [Defluviimonas sp. WL0002]
MFENASGHFRSVHSALKPKTALKNEGADGFRRYLSQGEHLFYEADRAVFVYEVVFGSLRLTRIQQDGRRHVVAFAFPGDIVGLPVDGRHSTECVAVAPVEVIAHRYDPAAPPEQKPGLHARVLAAALEEIRALQDHFLMLGRRSAAEKVAAFILWLEHRIGEGAGACRLIRLSMNRADIADHLGLTPETVSRTITQFRESRLIALDGAQTMLILDMPRMKSVAEGG